MKTVVVDANPFLRLFLDDIPEQVKFFERLIDKAKRRRVKLLVPQITIFELNFSLEKYYHFQKEEILIKLKALVKASYLEVQDRDIFDKAIKIFEENKISLADAFVLAYAVNNKGELFTFDKRLKKLA